ncbi:MAG TPA: FkbM family methyltransferase, partial [Salinimicrobium sp.]|nr:FkbM family methyltransferase [Salinimicrobium sp.]
DFFVNVGIGESRIPMEYYVLEESSMNTFDYDFIIKKKLVNKIKQKITVPVRTLEEILEENLNAHDRLDFFDVDVEGRDLEVLKTNNWNKYRPKVIMVESDTPLISGISSDIVQYLEQKDYRVIGKSIIQGDLGNIFLISK